MCWSECHTWCLRVMYVVSKSSWIKHTLPLSCRPGRAKPDKRCSRWPPTCRTSVWKTRQPAKPLHASPTTPQHHSSARTNTQNTLSLNITAQHHMCVLNNITQLKITHRASVCVFQRRHTLVCGSCVTFRRNPNDPQVHSDHTEHKHNKHHHQWNVIQNTHTHQQHKQLHLKPNVESVVKVWFHLKQHYYTRTHYSTLNETTPETL